MGRAEQQYRDWLQNVDEELLPELVALSEQTEKRQQCFGQDLLFGTAGLRGEMGIGPNRMNRYTVGRAAAGLGKVLTIPKVVIAYDNRRHSLDFARQAAKTLLGIGVEVYLFPKIAPTPLLSFAVRKLGCGAGIMITASHNSKEYNGLKCYGADGCQMTGIASDRVWQEMRNIDFFALPEGDLSRIHDVGEEVLLSYEEETVAQCLSKTWLAETDLKVLFTPLFGTGALVLPRIFRKAGLRHLSVVKSQMEPNPDFPACPNPNPELAEAYVKALEQANEEHPDLILATDPDADRLGTMVWDGRQYRLLSGNEIGCLLLDYFLRIKKEKQLLPSRPLLLKTVVTAPMAEKICEAHACEWLNLPVGFKYIGEQIRLLEEKGEGDRFLLGFEESNGYLCGHAVGDKDGILAALLVAELAAEQKKQGKSLLHRLEELYTTYGYYSDALEDRPLFGAAAEQQMKDFLLLLRQSPFERLGKRSVEVVIDYAAGEKRIIATGKKEGITTIPNNMLAFYFDDGCRLAIRPSGTEPKLKLYYFASGGKRADTKRALTEMKGAMAELLMIFEKTGKAGVGADEIYSI